MHFSRRRDFLVGVAPGDDALLDELWRRNLEFLSMTCERGEVVVLTG